MRVWDQSTQQQEVRKASVVERGRLSIKSMSSQGDEDDGFECQKMYGALGGSPES